MEDFVNATEVKIHRGTCSYFVNREKTTTTRWHEFPDLETAKREAEQISKKYTKGWKLAECCL